ncbi:MAG: methylamine utilization protein [Rhodanobacter sp.]
MQQQITQADKVKKNIRMAVTRFSRLAIGFGLWAAMAVAARAATVDVDVHDEHGAPVADAVISLLPLDRPAPAAVDAHAVIDQRHLSFVPQVLVVQTGTRVSFPNSDNVRHHVYSFSPAKTFQLKLYAGNHGSAETFDRPGVVTLGCNIHDWMLGYIVVIDSPWFAKTGADGRAEIPDVPAGRYTLHLWHPRQAVGTPVVAQAVTLGNGILSRHFTLSLHPAEQTNAPPPGLEIGLGDRLGEAHAH